MTLPNVVLYFHRPPGLVKNIQATDLLHKDKRKKIQNTQLFIDGNFFFDLSRRDTLKYELKRWPLSITILLADKYFVGFLSYSVNRPDTNFVLLLTSNQRTSALGHSSSINALFPSLIIWSSDFQKRKQFLLCRSPRTKIL